MMRLILMASLLLSLSPGMSAASPAPPPCFPERVVMQAAWMHDDTGRIVGGIRSGQEVRILEEKSPDHPGLTLVETKGLVVLRGWLDMYQLRVFTRRELETVPGTEWWLAEAPLRIEGGDLASASVACTECGGIFASQGEPRKVACSDIRGTLPDRLTRSDGNGARGETPSRPKGSAVRSVDSELTMTLDAGPRREWVPRAQLYLLERKGTRARVEEFDLVGWTRIGGWIDAGKVEPDSSQSLGWGTSGCAGKFSNPPLPRTLASTLRREVSLTASLEAGLATPLQAEADVEILARLDDKLFALWRRKDQQGVDTLLVVGWIPGDAVKTKVALPKSFTGQLRKTPGQTTPPWSEFHVSMRSGPLRFDAAVDAKGQFRVPATLVGTKQQSPSPSTRACGPDDEDDTVSLLAKSRDGTWTGSTSLKSGKPIRSISVGIVPSAPTK